MRPLRILHVTPAVFHETLGMIGGGERYPFELARNMADLTPTTLVGFGSDGGSYQVGRLNVIVLGNSYFVRRQRLNPINQMLLPLLMKHDVIHCHQKYVLTSSLVAIYGQLFKKKVFVSDHGGGGWDLSAYVSTDSWYTGELHDSDYSRHLAHQEHVPNSHVIYGGVDTDKFRPLIHLIPVSERAVVYVGRLLPHKGVDYLIRGLPENMCLQVIGRPFDSNYVKYLKTLAAGKSVTFVFDATDDMIVDAYRRALCVVLPSVYTAYNGQYSAVPELLGQTLIEGMSCGVPGIATTVASLPEVVVDGTTGFLVPPNDPDAISMRLRQLREQPEVVDSMGREARARVLSRFTWGSVAKHCLEIYHSQEKKTASGI